MSREEFLAMFFLLDDQGQKEITAQSSKAS